MNNPISSVFPSNLSAALAAFALLLALPSHFADAQTQQVSPKYSEQWEYRVVVLSAVYDTVQPLGSSNLKPFEDGLNKFGADGWELVTLDVQQNVRRTAIFKRPVKQERK